MKPYQLFGCALIFMFLLLGCNRPKVITSSTEEAPTEQSTGIFTAKDKQASTTQAENISPDVHKVQVEEVLPASKYVYLKVIENEEKYWIATLNKEINPGQTYYYRDGLLKTNFESKEYNRVFEKIYLVSNLVQADHGNPDFHTPITKTEKSDEISVEQLDPVEGSISIKDLVSQKTTYANQTVHVSGTCVKLNPNIMGRHWIHLKDGTMDEYDLVITSDIPVSEGQKVTMTGKVILDKDFGSGYKYDLLIEEGKVLQIIQ